MAGAGRIAMGWNAMMADTSTASHLITDELDGVVSMLCTRYPSRSRESIVRLVSEAYDQLAAHATVTSHLIPLTVNRCRNVLTDDADVA